MVWTAAAENSPGLSQHPDFRNGCVCSGVAVGSVASA